MTALPHFPQMQLRCLLLQETLLSFTSAWIMCATTIPTTSSQKAHFAIIYSITPRLLPSFSHDLKSRSILDCHTGSTQIWLTERLNQGMKKQFFFFFFLFLFLFRAIPVVYGSSRLGVISELQLPAYTTVTATPDLSHIYSLQCSLCLTHWTRPGIQPASSRILCQVLSLMHQNGNCRKQFLFSRIL